MIGQPISFISIYSRRLQCPRWLKTYFPFVAFVIFVVNLAIRDNLFLTNKPNFHISLTNFKSFISKRLAEIRRANIKEILKKQTQFKPNLKLIQSTSVHSVVRNKKISVNPCELVPPKPLAKGDLRFKKAFPATDSENTRYLSTTADSLLWSSVYSQLNRWLTASSSSRRNRGLSGRGCWVSSARRRIGWNRSRRFRWRTIDWFDCGDRLISCLFKKSEYRSQEY